MAEAIIKLELQRPLNKSHAILLDLITVWGLRVIKLGSKDKDAILGVPNEKFPLMFNKKPSLGDVKFSEGIAHFVKSIKVIKVNVNP